MMFDVMMVYVNSHLRARNLSYFSGIYYAMICGDCGCSLHAELSLDFSEKKHFTNSKETDLNGKLTVFQTTS
jgi:hypothetical protein